MEVQANGFQAELFNESEFEHYWPYIERMWDLVPHTWAGMTKESVVSRALNGTLQVWGVGDGAIKLVLFTQIATFSAGPVLQIIWGAGSEKMFEKAGDAVDAALEFFAKSQSCKRIEIIGRDGWEKPMARRGFKKVAIILSRDIAQTGIQ